MSINGSSENMNLWAGASVSPHPSHLLSTSPRRHRPADADDDFDEEEGRTQLGAVVSIPHLEATPVEPFEEAKVCSAVPMTPTGWEKHKRCIITVFIITFVAFVAAIVLLAIQGGSPDVQADPSPLFSTCSSRVKEVLTDCGGAECKQVASGGCVHEELEATTAERDCSASGSAAVCTFDVLCCRTMASSVVAATTLPAGSESTRGPTEATSRPTEALSATQTATQTSRPTNPSSTPAASRQTDFPSAILTITPTSKTTKLPSATPTISSTSRPPKVPSSTLTIVPTSGLTVGAAGWVKRGGGLDGEAAGDWLGRSVALSGDGTVLAIGAPGTTTAGSSAGHVRTFVLDASTNEWIQRGDDLDGEATDDFSGCSVALSSDGNVLAVGADGNDGAGIPNTGHVRVYTWDAPATEWVQRGDDLDGEAPQDQSGRSIALSSDGNVLAVGAAFNDGGGTNAGHVRVHVWDAPATKWVQRGEDLNGEAAHDWSGWSVALSSDGTVLAVGADRNDDAGNNAGHVRVYVWDALAAGWVRRGKDLDGEGARDFSGSSAALSCNGTVIAVGAHMPNSYDAGHVRVYAWDFPTAKWVQRGDTLNGEAAGDESGYSIALSSDGNVLAVGARYNNGAGDASGHVRVHEWDAPVAKWVQRGGDLDSKGAGNESGSSIALSSDGGVLVVGAPASDGAGNNAGFVSVYEWQATNKA